MNTTIKALETAEQLRDQLEALNQWGWYDEYIENIHETIRALSNVAKRQAQDALSDWKRNTQVKP